MMHFSGKESIRERFVEAVDMIKRRPNLTNFLLKGYSKLIELQTPRIDEK